MFRRSGFLKKTGDFGSQFKLIAHLDPAGREGSAPGCRGLLGLLPNNGGIEDRKDSYPPYFQAVSSKVGGNSPHVSGVAGKSFQSNLSRVTRWRDDVHHFRGRAIQRVTTLGQLLPGFFEQFSVHKFSITHLIRFPPVVVNMCHLMHL